MATLGSPSEVLQKGSLQKRSQKIYKYGPPQILQTDDGREFNNNDLANVMKEFEMRHIYGRLYHPQSQGRVERFNRSVVEFFKRTISKEETWSEQLPYFYYQYNNRVNKATRPSTPFRLFFGRPNMAAPTTEQVDINNLTPEER